MANGQPVTLTRRLHHTIASDSTTATSSSQVIGEPQSTNAGASAGPARLCACSIMSAARGRSKPTTGEQGSLQLALRADLDEHFVGLDHAQLAARLLLDHLEAGFEVEHLGGHALVAALRLLVLRA